MREFKAKYNNGAIYNCMTKWSWNFASMKDCDLWLVLSGKGMLRVNGVDCKLSAGSVLVLIPGNRVHGSHDPKNPLKVAAIHFDFIGNPPLKDYLYSNLESAGFIGELMQQAIIASGNREQEDADFWLSAALRKILPPESHDIPGNYAEGIDKLCVRIINRPEQSYTVNGMARELCLCKDHFSRVFKGYKGVTPLDFVIGARIKQACALLLNSNMTASEISDQLGYSSVNFFCRQFKAVTGQTQAQYRKRL
ncbi:MAG TPA: hypothetical protein DET40_08170 [Lentisphaeria bacterium]|nr:MAG: hypothetical protein A2X45_10375 [Lentisphaerae bacterium GWF2_50_93]HCE43508.1 hypothetical protein [Lentisphaeria bacterium]